MKNVQTYLESTGQSLSSSSIQASFHSQIEVNQKRGLIDQAKSEKRLLLPIDVSFYHSEIKEEVGNPFIN
jgi:hypothetical protein